MKPGDYVSNTNFNTENSAETLIVYTGVIYYFRVFAYGRFKLCLCEQNHAERSDTEYGKHT
jgi:hypothetical protein